MTTEALFGAGATSVTAAAATLASVLQVEFELHNSYFLGGDYHLWQEADDEISVRPNALDEDGVPIEGSHPEHETLLYLTGDSVWERWGPILRALDWLDLLRIQTESWGSSR